MLFFLIIAMWVLIAAGVIPCEIWLVALLNGLTGAAGSILARPTCASRWRRCRRQGTISLRFSR